MKPRYGPSPFVLFRASVTSISSSKPTGCPEGLRHPDCEVLVSIDEQHVALPRLYGAPAYARPAAAIVADLRPFDPDELPIEAFQSEDDRRFAAGLPARAWAPGGTVLEGHSNTGRSRDGLGRADRRLQGRPFRLRSIAGRLIDDA